MKIVQALKFAVEEFDQVGIETKFLDARLLLSNAIGCSMEYLISNYDLELNEIHYNLFNSFVIRRKNYEPLAYILGKKEFYGRDFIINKNVLIPRADTEILIDSVIKLFNKFYAWNGAFLNILDLGTGSGNIALTIAAEILCSKVTAVDISESSIKIAKSNAKLHQLEDRVSFICSNWYENLDDKNDKFDFIVSNPPYINFDDIDFVSKEVRYYEPFVALYASENGLINFNKIISGATNHLNKNGKIFLEIGFNQLEEVKSILIKNNFLIYDLVKDLSGKVRVIIADFVL